MAFKLTLHCYNGMEHKLIEEGDLEDCRKLAAIELRYHRNTLNYPITTRWRGSAWELETGEDAAGIGDHEGILELEEIDEEEEFFESDEELEADIPWDLAPNYCSNCGEAEVGEDGDICATCEAKRKPCKRCGTVEDEDDLEDGICWGCLDEDCEGEYDDEAT